ncbi:hypothetical protein VMCG_06993 [Cytospora schulzeri]|uniref:Uncharacterized protein n=1 Tax=Cytospora schulzeri TaxID=448051 RepID=A0A423W427_9PEZI|nr:hypothetical protein VMCG_06993 [Valsa malicola]
MPLENVQGGQSSTQVGPGREFLERLDAVLHLARSHHQQFSEIVSRLEEARNAPFNSVRMDTALIRAHAAIKRHYKYTRTEVLLLLTARDGERRTLDAMQQQLSDLLVERFGQSFYGNPLPGPGTSSVVVLCLLVTVGLGLLYFGVV